MKKRKLILLVLGISLVVVIIAAAIFAFQYSGSKSSDLPKTPPKRAVEPLGRDKSEPVDDTYTVQDRILLISDKNVWVVSSDGVNRQQLTFDGGTVEDALEPRDIYYPDVAWQSPGVASYVRCQVTCSVIVHDLGTNDTETIVALSEDFSIGSLDWGTVDEELNAVYLVTSRTGEVIDQLMKIQPGGEQQLIYTFPARLGRGGSIFDDVSVKFSPASTFVSVQNTVGSFVADQIVIIDTASWAPVLNLGKEYYGHAYLDENTLLTSRVESGVSALYRLNIEALAVPELVTANGLLPHDVWDTKVTGVKVADSGYDFAVYNTETDESDIPGVSFNSTQFLNNTGLIVGQLYESSEYGPRTLGINIFDLLDLSALDIAGADAGAFDVER